MSQRFLLLLLFSLFIHYSSSASSVKLRIHQNGINYAAGIAKEILEEELKKVQIPEQRIDTHGLHARFFNISLHSLGLPNTNVTFQGGALVLTTASGFVDGKFRFQGSKRIIVKLTTHGTADIHLSNVVSRIVLNWKQGTDKPQLKVTACEGRLDQVKLKFHGNIIVKIVNIFKGKIGKTLRDKISKLICPEVNKLVETRVNKILADIPSLFPVTKEGKKIFSIEYDNLTTAVGNNFLDVSANAIFHFNNKKCFAVQKSYPDGPATNMLSAWGSQSVPDCLLQAFHESNQLQYLITNKSEKIAPYLRTTCPSDGFLPKCIGALFPKLASDHPNRTVDILAFSSTSPTVTITPSGIRTLVYSSLNVILDQQVLAQFQLNLTAVFVPKLQGNHFFGTINVEKAAIRLTASTIGEIDPKILELAGPFITVGANYVLQPIAEKGIMVPVFHEVKIADSSFISLLDGYLRSDVDIVKNT